MNNYTTSIMKAREGRYKEALQYLNQGLINRECSDVEALDLQAKIYAQQGMYVQAQACWLKAYELDPGNPEYINALNRISQSSRPYRSWRLYVIAVFAALLMFVVIFQQRNFAQDLYARQDLLNKDIQNIQDEITNNRKHSASAFDDLAGTQSDIVHLVNRNNAEVENKISILATSAEINKLEDEVNGKISLLGTDIEQNKKQFVSDVAAIGDKIYKSNMTLESLQSLTENTITDINDFRAENLKQISNIIDYNELSEQNIKSNKQLLDVLSKEIKEIDSSISIFGEKQSLQRKHDAKSMEDLNVEIIEIKSLVESLSFCIDELLSLNLEYNDETVDSEQ